MIELQLQAKRAHDCALGSRDDRWVYVFMSVTLLRMRRHVRVPVGMRTSSQGIYRYVFLVIIIMLYIIYTPKNKRIEKRFKFTSAFYHAQCITIIQRLRMMIIFLIVNHIQMMSNSHYNAVLLVVKLR